MENSPLDLNVTPAQSFRLRDNAQRAKTALVIGYILLGATLLSAICSYLDYDITNRVIEASEPISKEEAASVQSRDALSSICLLLSSIAFIVVFIMWFRRAYFNLEQMGVKTQFTEGWASGAWFVPFLNLVRPFTIMREIWENYRYKAAEKNEALNRGETNSVLGFWWALWLIGNILNNISTRMTWDDNPSIETIRTASLIGTIAGALDIISLLLLLNIIKKISSWENSLRADTPAYP
ncbi:MAG TPA: DUF4328 domain-containing protein [Bacteroidia bacterium]|jgi:hypothetical protein